jgi:hypothetical protein
LSVWQWHSITKTWKQKLIITVSHMMHLKSAGKTVWENGGTVPCIFNHSTKWWCGDCHALATLTPCETAHSTHWTEGQVGPRAHLGALENKHLLH